MNLGGSTRFCKHKRNSRTWHSLFTYKSFHRSPYKLQVTYDNSMHGIVLDYQLTNLVWSGSSRLAHAKDNQFYLVNLGFYP